MKLLLVLLISFNLYGAKTPEEELADQAIEDARMEIVRGQLESIGIKDNKPKSQEVIARLSGKCGVVENSAFYYPKLFLIENASVVLCFLDKFSELEAEDAANDKKIKDKKDKFDEVQAFDCDTITGIELAYLKLLCEQRK